jgi:DNA modification methylase
MIDMNIIKTVHPFPARMAPSIVWDRLPEDKPPLRILDPMAGSGTTLAIARSKGHFAYGVDRDPLAVIIAKAWCCNLDKEKLYAKAEEVLEKAKKTAKSLSSATAFPSNSDAETKDFVKFWFDLQNRKQLTGLSKHISLVHDEIIQVLLWTAFSRMIITKKIGVSLAMDISHSRPHKVYKKAPVTAFDLFPKAVDRVIKANPFSEKSILRPDATMIYGDSRNLSFSDNYFDYVITSPPYLNAIDYLRGHKLSLVWMKNSISNIRELRTTNIGAEVQSDLSTEKHILDAVRAFGTIDKLTVRQRGFLIRYVKDMDLACSEIRRVLKPEGKVIYVIGDSSIKGLFVSNSNAIRSLSEYHGLILESIEDRLLPEYSRYLPPPSNNKAGKQLQGRMRKEVILVMKKL